MSFWQLALNLLSEGYYTDAVLSEIGSDVLMGSNI